MAPTGVALASQLGGVTLTSGVYAFVPGTVLLNGTLHLNAEGNNNAYWVFQIPSDLTTAVGSSVVVDNFGSNGGNDDGLFWVVGSSAGIFGSTSFQGNILALTSITLDDSATILHGRALARNGTVTMDTNTISFLCYNGGPGLSGGLKYDTAGNIVPIPEPATMLLFGTGIAGLASARMKRKKK